MIGLCLSVLGEVANHGVSCGPACNTFSNLLALPCIEICVQLSSPLLGLVIIRIQERVPVTPFKDQICGPKVTYHLHQVGLPHGGINQWAAVVLQLQNSRVQPIIILHPMGQDEVTPNVR